MQGYRKKRKAPIKSLKKFKPKKWKYIRIMDEPNHSDSLDLSK